LKRIDWNGIGDGALPWWLRRGMEFEVRVLLETPKEVEYRHGGLQYVLRHLVGRLGRLGLLWRLDVFGCIK
jgi:hypothetical protein